MYKRVCCDGHKTHGMTRGRGRRPAWGGTSRGRSIEFGHRLGRRSRREGRGCCRSGHSEGGSGPAEGDPDEKGGSALGALNRILRRFQRVGSEA